MPSSPHAGSNHRGMRTTRRAFAPSRRGSFHIAPSATNEAMSTMAAAHANR